MKTTITFELEKDEDFNPIDLENLSLYNQMAKSSRMTHKVDGRTITLTFNSKTVKTLISLQQIFSQIERDKVNPLYPF